MYLYLPYIYCTIFYNFYCAGLTCPPFFAFTVFSMFAQYENICILICSLDMSSRDINNLIV